MLTDTLHCFCCISQRHYNFCLHCLQAFTQGRSWLLTLSWPPSPETPAPFWLLLWDHIWTIFSPVEQVNHLPFSEDRTLYGCLTTFKRLQARLLLCAVTTVEENRDGCMRINSVMAQMNANTICITLSLAPLLPLGLLYQVRITILQYFRWFQTFCVILTIAELW